VILLEVSVFPYNEGVPLITDVLANRKIIRYRPIDVFDLQYDNGGTLLQMDILFRAMS
jgi:hypothetical protein